MAMTRCKECGHAISSKAAACPSCGHKTRSTSKFTWFVAIIFGLPVIYVMATSWTHKDAPQSTTRTIDRRMAAAGACMQFIKRRLHDPGSAEFGPTSEVRVEINKDRAKVVRSARAKNDSGAMRLNEYVCLLEFEGNNVREVIVAESGSSSVGAQYVSDWLAGR